MLEVLETRRRVLGRRHPDTLLSVSNIGYLYREMGDFGAAEPFWRETLDGFRQVFGDEHWDTLISVINLGLLLRDQGRFQETIELVAPIEPLARATFQGDNARRLASLLTALGRARVGLAHDEEQFIVAEANLLEAHGIFVLTRGETHKNTLESVQGLIDLYTAWAAAEPDAGHAAKATEWQAVLDAAQGATP